MGLAKIGYKNAIQGTTKVNVAIDENGYIAPEGTQAAGVRKFNITKVSAENSLEDNTAVLNFFLGLVGGRQDQNTNTMAVTWQAGEEI